MLRCAGDAGRVSGGAQGAFLGADGNEARGPARRAALGGGTERDG